MKIRFILTLVFAGLQRLKVYHCTSEISTVFFGNRLLTFIH